MNDSISRQQAIDAMNGLPKYFDKTDTLCLDYADVLAVLSEHLPSTEPDFDTNLRINKAYDDGYETGYLQGKHDWSEKKIGRWNFIGNQMFECTECGVCYTQNQFHQMRVRITDSRFPKFCPDCGAEMKE